MKKLANLRVFPTILAGMIVGISFIILTDMWIPATVCAIALPAAIAFAIAAYKKNRKTFRAAVVGVGCFVAGTVFGISSALYANAQIESREIFAEDVQITAKIEVGSSSDLSGAVDSCLIILNDLVVDGKEVEGRAQMYSLQLPEGGFNEGDVITFTGTVTTLTTDITTPYKASSLAEGVLYNVTADENEDSGGITVEGSSLDFFDKIKKAVAAKLSENASDDAARFMYAMLFGDSAVIGDEIRSDFSVTGTAHLLAVSGLHVGMLAGALLFILKKLRINAAVRSVVVLAALIFFCALCGFSPSTVRATVMIGVSMAAALCGLRYDPLSGMSFSAILLLFVSPYNLYSLGFLMSFLAVYGLILFAKPLKGALLKAKFPDWLAGALSATLAANATLLPVMLYVFGETSLIFAVANCIIVPFAGFFFPMYIVLLPLSFLPYAGFLATVASVPFLLTARVVEWLAGIAFPTVYIEFNWATIMLWLIVATAVSGLCAMPVVAKKIIASVSIICIVAVVVLQNASMLSFENKVTCFSGYGCSGVVVQSADEGDFIVFSGELDESAAQAAVQAMNKSKLRQVDFIVKFGAELSESEILDEYAEQFGTRILYAEYSETTEYDVRNTTELTLECSVICTYTYTAIYLGGVDMLVTAGSDYRTDAAEYDVIVCAALTDIPEGPEYLVSDEAYLAGGNNCLPSDFTFWTVGDRIIKTNKWRFA